MKRWRPLILILLTAALLGSFQLPVRAVATRVTIAVTCDQAPYQFIGESGEPEGMLIELLEAAAREKGTELHYMICDSTSKCFEALRSGKADVVLTDTSRNSTLAEETVHLDLVSSSLCVLAGNSVAQAIDAGISIKRYSAVMSLRDKQISAHYLGTNSMVGENLTRVCRDQTETAEIFFSGGADIAILERAEANDMLKRYQNAEEYTIISNYVAPITYAAFLRPNDDALYRNLETGLTGLYSSGRYGEIAEKWTSEQEKTWISAEMQRRIIVMLEMLGEYA